MKTNEKKRQAVKRNQILGLLKSRGMNGATNEDLSDVSLRYGGHLGELYRLGYKIKKVQMGDGLFNYILLEEPSREHHERKKALDVLMTEVKKEEIIDAPMLEGILNNFGIMVRYKPNTYNAI
ncbi:hypothetical protein RVS70_05780 [Virgibacillus sp. M23]|uniref:hypothetical protein n=1 Tax=Virgibacillus sp. M23 TaxID=3079030 RepID=UPI002A90B6FE|nr:hypothetical protein [Virgibacillus sp. M23]MDY7043711.1 hypothetical protein [Virgibacillus sp. M23]